MLTDKGIHSNIANELCCNTSGCGDPARENESGTDTIPTHSEYEDHGERPFPMVKTCVGRQSAGET